MSFGKWNTSGELTWGDGECLSYSDLNDSVDEAVLPIGSVVAWLKSFTGTPQSLPSGWLECDGSTISDGDSPLNGQTLPDMNGNNRFLRGNTTSGTTGAGVGNHRHTTNSLAHACGGVNAWKSPSGYTNPLPVYYEVV